MNKNQLDELYHNLRELSVTSDGLQKDAIIGIVSHLTQSGGDYTGLLRFLSYYGENYILPEVRKVLNSHFSTGGFSRVVEFGAGFGWLGRGISNGLGFLPVVFVDKRQYLFTDIVADLEAKNGAKRILDELRSGDLIVMSELLHCLDDPEKALRPYTKWPMLAVEYWPTSKDYRESYNAQVERFYCKPIKDMRSIFPNSKLIEYHMDTHLITLVLPI